MFANLLAALAFTVVNTTVEAAASVLRTGHDFKDWEWEMLTTPMGDRR